MGKNVKSKTNFLFLFLFAVGGFVIAEEAKSQGPQPKVDERIELLGIVFRLAEVPGYQVLFKEYDEAINRHFAPFKTHPAVLAAKLLRGKAAAFTHAVHISIENGRVVLPNANSEKTLEKLVSTRFRQRAAELFVKQLDDFYVKSRFHEFFEANREKYRKTEQNFKAINDKIDYSWFKKFFGDVNLEHWHFVLTYIGDGGYGDFCCFKDGHKEYFVTLTVLGPDAHYPDEGGFTALVVHEFNHFFCNPIVEKYIDKLTPATERTFPFVSNNISYYYNGKTMPYEYLVRACMVRYLLHCGNKDEAKRQMLMDTRDGLFWMEELVELLGRYEKERDKYPTLAEFMPEIVKLQNEIVTDEYVAKLRKQSENRPKISKTNPPDKAKNINPALTEISITFDRPMMDILGWDTRNIGKKTFPERSKHSPPVWSNDKRTCTIHNVVLKPGKTYNILLNWDVRAENFCSTENIPLHPMRITFTTKAE